MHEAQDIWDLCHVNVWVLFWEDLLLPTLVSTEDAKGEILQSLMMI